MGEPFHSSANGPWAPRSPSTRKNAYLFVLTRYLRAGYSGVQQRAPPPKKGPLIGDVGGSNRLTDALTGTREGPLAFSGV